MGKDLRTLAVSHKLRKYPRLDGSLWGLKNPQPFFPPLETLFKTETVGDLPEYGIRVNESIESVVSETHIRTSKGATVPVHRKTTMLLSPFQWMRGDYGVLGLPKPATVANDIQEGLQSPHSAGYVGALASIVLSESGCAHFPKVYGVYVGLAGSHTIDISDDYEELSERHWFANNLGKTFDLKLRQVQGVEFQHTRSQRAGVVLGEESTVDDLFMDVEADHVSEPSLHSHSRSQASSSSAFQDDASTESSEDEYELLSCDCSSDGGEEDEDEEEDEDPFAWATFKDVPVITTVMESLQGTFYDLMNKHPEPEKHVAWVAQVVFALAYAQRMFGLTHNDLHCNNVMYVETPQEYLYYKHQNTCYRVPTYGYLIKIIDFDRAILSLRLTGMKEPRQFISSQFHPDDEAAGQYNIEPFFTQNHPRIPPNPSFDLCRFATSVYWDLFPQGPDVPTSHPLQEVFRQWMTQQDGSSVFFRKQRDRHDRYHGFGLYKAIARYCKDSATPRREITKLSGYAVQAVPLGAACLHVEA